MCEQAHLLEADIFSICIIKYGEFNYEVQLW